MVDFFSISNSNGILDIEMKEDYTKLIFIRKKYIKTKKYNI